MNPAVACYCRISTGNESQASSLQNQSEFFADFFSHKGIDNYSVYADEGISGTKLKKRKAFVKMVADAVSGKFSAIFVKDISRFARNTLDFLTVYRELKAHGVRVHFITGNMDSSEVDEAYITILAAMAQAESANTSKRIKFSKNLSAERGRVPNYIYGYDRVDRYTLKPNPDEARTVRLIFELYTEQAMGSGKIADYLNSLLIPTRSRKSGWTQSSISEMLKNQIYIGKVINRKSYVADFLTSRRSHNPSEEWIAVDRPDFRLISDELFEKTQNEIIRRNEQKNIARSRHNNAHPFSNLLFCSECGRAFRRCARRSKTGEPARIWWTCSTRNSKGILACQNDFILPETELHDTMIAYIEPHIQDGLLLKKLVHTHLQRQLEEVDSHLAYGGYRSIVSQLDFIASQRKKKRAQFEVDIITLETLQLELEELERARQKFENQLSMFDSDFSDFDPCRLIDEFYSSASQQDLRLIYDNALLKSILRRIIVYPSGKLQVYAQIPLSQKRIPDLIDRT